MQDIADAEIPAATSGRARFVVPLAMLLVGTALGGGGAWFVTRPASAAEGEAAAEAGQEGAAEGDAAAGEHATGDGATGGDGKVTPGDGSAVTSLGTFTVNLRGTGGGRVLRLEVQVEGAATQAEAVTARAAPIRDSIITAVSDYTWSELEGAGGKTRLRDELLARVNGAATPSTIDRIYFTQFVVQ